MASPPAPARLGRAGRVPYLGSRAPFEHRAHADMEFVCEDGRLPCHRFVVVAQSRYLWRLMLGGDGGGQNYASLVLPGVRKELMTLVLRFLYTGDLFVQQDQLREVKQLLERVLQLDTKINFPDCLDDDAKDAKDFKDVRPEEAPPAVPSPRRRGRPRGRGRGSARGERRGRGRSRASSTSSSVARSRSAVRGRANREPSPQREEKEENLSPKKESAEKLEKLEPECKLDESLPSKVTSAEFAEGGVNVVQSRELREEQVDEKPMDTTAREDETEEEEDTESSFHEESDVLVERVADGIQNDGVDAGAVNRVARPNMDASQDSIEVVHDDNVDSPFVNMENPVQGLIGICPKEEAQTHFQQCSTPILNPPSVPSPTMSEIIGEKVMLQAAPGTVDREEGPASTEGDVQAAELEVAHGGSSESVEYQKENVPTVVIDNSSNTMQNSAFSNQGSGEISNYTGINRDCSELKAKRNHLESIVEKVNAFHSHGNKQEAKTAKKLIGPRRQNGKLPHENSSTTRVCKLISPNGPGNDLSKWYCSDPLLDDDEKVHQKLVVTVKRLKVENADQVSAAPLGTSTPLPKRARGRSKSTSSTTTRRGRGGRGGRGGSRQRGSSKAIVSSFAPVVKSLFKTKRTDLGEQWATANPPEHRDRNQGVVLTAKKSPAGRRGRVGRFASVSDDPEASDAFGRPKYVAEAKMGETFEQSVETVSAADPPRKVAAHGILGLEEEEEIGLPVSSNKDSQPQNKDQTAKDPVPGTSAAACRVPGKVLHRGEWISEKKLARIIAKREKTKKRQKIIPYNYQYNPGLTVSGRPRDETLFRSERDEDGVHQCNSCDKVYAREYSLNSHISRCHNPRRVHPCSECGKAFSSATAIEKHMLSHKPKEEWPFECPICKRAFQARGDVPKHWLTAAHRDDDVPKPGTKQFDELLQKAARFPNARKQKPFKFKKHSKNRILFKNKSERGRLARKIKVKSKVTSSVISAGDESSQRSTSVGSLSDGGGGESNANGGVCGGGVDNSQNLAPNPSRGQQPHHQHPFDSLGVHYLAGQAPCPDPQSQMVHPQAMQYNPHLPESAANPSSSGYILPPQVTWPVPTPADPAHMPLPPPLQPTMPGGGEQQPY